MHKELTSLWVRRLPGAYDLAAHVPLGEIYQAACPLVIPEKEGAIGMGSVDVGVVDMERIKALGAFADKSGLARVCMHGCAFILSFIQKIIHTYMHTYKNMRECAHIPPNHRLSFSVSPLTSRFAPHVDEKLKGLKRPSPPMAKNGQGKRAVGVENAMADLKRKREIFVEKCSQKMPLGWSKMESVGAEIIAKRARIDRTVEEAQTSLDAAVRFSIQFILMGVCLGVLSSVSCC
jgi:hypothetical protein